MDDMKTTLQTNIDNKANSADVTELSNTVSVQLDTLSTNVAAQAGTFSQQVDSALASVAKQTELADLDSIVGMLNSSLSSAIEGAYAE